MRDAITIFFEIVLAIAGAVFFGSLTVALGAFGIGCLLFGSCWGVLGWHRRRGTKPKVDG